MSAGLVLSVVRSGQVPSELHGTYLDAQRSYSPQAILEIANAPKFRRRCVECNVPLVDDSSIEIRHLDGEHTNDARVNQVPVCTLCHAVDHVDLITRRWPDRPGTIIYLPELTQVEVNNVAQALAVALYRVERDGEEAPGGLDPAGLYQCLEARVNQLRTAENPVLRSLDRPYTVARLLAAMTAEQYAARGRHLDGLRWLPDRRLLKDIAWHWGGIRRSADTDAPVRGQGRANVSVMKASPVDTGFGKLLLADWTRIAGLE